MRADTTLRDATTADSESLSALADCALKETGYDARMVSRFAARNTMEITTTDMLRHPFWVAEQGSEIVGCISLDPKDGKTGQICNFYVTPKLKGTGIGSLLWFRLMLVAQTQGFTALSVISDPLSVSFYERLGFVTQSMIPVPALSGCEAAYMEMVL
ncbi:GNAT family N-acetyltransferase [Sulfitobacter sp.]|uniref:GNAT family N-acetyltransferase n=1 Tax=Sulfitobacter sp. TaxID=1903071 RepID=UPI003298059E